MRISLESGLRLALGVAIGLLATAPAASAADHVIRSSHGVITAVGPLRPATTGVDGLRALFGSPTSVRRHSSACDVRFAGRRITVKLASFGNPNPCTQGAAQVAKVDGAPWRTQRGLRVGDRSSRIKNLYPRARFRSGKWELQQANLFGSRTPTLFAFVRGHRVRALQAYLGGAGE